MTTSVKRPSNRTLIASSLTGTTIEYFDFFAYATAASLVFNKVFFPDHDPLVGTILAFGGIAVGFVARPFGAALFGHFGDRVGRKSALFVTLSIMGIGTCGIGLVPSYDQIGIWAPILLMVLRLLQGLALGGEWGGAVLITHEHAKPGKEGALTSFPSSGMPLGLMLSTLCFLGMSAMISDSAFESWGWRVPFIIGVALVGVGLFIRSRIPETDDMIELKKSDDHAKMPLAVLFRTRMASLLLCAFAFLAQGFYFYAAYSFGVAYGTESVGYSYNSLLVSTLLFSFMYLVSILFSGWLSDRLGRKRVMYFGFAATFVTVIPFFAMLSSGSLSVAVLAFVMAGISNGFMYGPYAALLCEAFEAKVRYTGISLGLTIGGVLGSAFSPMLFTESFRMTNSWMPAAAFVMVSAIISAGAVAALKKANGSASGALGSRGSLGEQPPSADAPATAMRS
ncbi:MFS family permease [Spinactinospora alkalitolerans]|uniref:MFS family permease n=1 Tax=Spinactinospora alkalitolerans TaxID=687207 RepID=A0A852U8P3_9ACTN|nr:MFS transporter [Spinactinospora alkalitolerans]NYE50464.1 MFS family permease [Spinactinospora alkalitolerans]